MINTGRREDGGTAEARGRPVRAAASSRRACQARPVVETIPILVCMRVQSPLLVEHAKSGPWLTYDHTSLNTEYECSIQIVFYSGFVNIITKNHQNTTLVLILVQALNSIKYIRTGALSTQVWRPLPLGAAALGTQTAVWPPLANGRLVWGWLLFVVLRRSLVPFDAADELTALALAPTLEPTHPTSIHNQYHLYSKL